MNLKKETQKVINYFNLQNGEQKKIPLMVKVFVGLVIITGVLISKFS